MSSDLLKIQAFKKHSTVLGAAFFDMEGDSNDEKTKDDTVRLWADTCG